MNANKFLILMMTFLCGLTAFGAEKVSGNRARTSRTKVESSTDSVSIEFRQSKWDLDRNFGRNAVVLDSVTSRLTNVFNDSVFLLRHVSIYGGASPEGSVEFNKFLSDKRAAALFGWFDRYNQLSDLDKTYTFYGRDWAGVLRLAEKDDRLPYRDETLELLRTIVDEKNALGGEEPAGSLERMKKLRKGVPYQYLYKNIFPGVRASKLVIDYDRILAPDLAATEGFELSEPLCDVTTSVEIADSIESMPYDTIRFMEPEVKPFYMDLRTNMLYDALALPNLGVEFALGKRFSIGGNWLYGWWKTDRRHRYWRAYGGELFGRWWFGKAARRKPLTGHHLGAYAQAYTYDFEWGGEGEMGGKPGGSIWDKCFWSAGLEYGYSLPVGKRINIDFSLGVGYTTGLYHKYDPQDGHYVWQSTHRRRYFGPTKLEIAFVWLLGKGNVNRKGGEQ